MRLPKAEKSRPDAETSSAWQKGLVLVLLSSGTWFGISILGLENFGFKAPPCRRGSLLHSKSPVSIQGQFFVPVQMFGRKQE
jgi:hypothetical protein